MITNKEAHIQKLNKLVFLIDEKDQLQQGDYSYDVLDAQINELWTALEEMGLSTKAINQYVEASL
jgi:hypothetical protein